MVSNFTPWIPRFHTLDFWFYTLDFLIYTLSNFKANEKSISVPEYNLITTKMFETTNWVRQNWIEYLTKSQNLSMLYILALFNRTTSIKWPHALKYSSQKFWNNHCNNYDFFNIKLFFYKNYQDISIATNRRTVFTNANLHHWIPQNICTISFLKQRCVWGITAVRLIIKAVGLK